MHWSGYISTALAASSGSSGSVQSTPVSVVVGEEVAVEVEVEVEVEVDAAVVDAPVVVDELDMAVVDASLVPLVDVAEASVSLPPPEPGGAHSSATFEPAPMGYRKPDGHVASG
jgi:hypothetical protein